MLVFGVSCKKWPEGKGDSLHRLHEGRELMACACSAAQVLVGLSRPIPFRSRVRDPDTTANWPAARGVLSPTGFCPLIWSAWRQWRPQRQTTRRVRRESYAPATSDSPTTSRHRLVNLFIHKRPLSSLSSPPLMSLFLFAFPLYDAEDPLHHLLPSTHTNIPSDYHTCNWTPRALNTSSTPALTHIQD